MKKRGVVQQDVGDREGWRKRAVKGLAKPLLAWEICQDNERMLFLSHNIYIAPLLYIFQR